jgi:hypothetical protein
MLGVCFSNQAIELKIFLVYKTGPGDGPDKTSDLGTAICLRYEDISVLYKAKFNCKQTITFARSIRNSISGSSAMFGCNYSATS